MNVASVPRWLEPSLSGNILNKFKTRIGEGEKTLQYIVKMAFFQFWHPVICAVLTCLWYAIALFMASSNRSKFLEMCDGLLARVEPPLRSVLEQASKCICILYSAYRRDIRNASFLWVLTELGQMYLVHLTISCLAVTSLLKFSHKLRSEILIA